MLFAVDGTTSGRQHRFPRGYQQREAGLKGVEADLALEAWQEEVSAMLPSPEELDGRYADFFGWVRADPRRGEVPNAEVLLLLEEQDR